MSLQSAIRWILPREDHFYEFLEKQASVAHEAAVALTRLKDGKTLTTEVRDALQDLEHQGDTFVHQMEDALARTFVTPLDREDLQKLSSELDDIIDLANLTARACVLYGVERPTAPMLKLMDTLVSCTETLKGALPKLRAHKYAELMEDGRTIRRLEKEGDAVFRGAVSVLFHDPNVSAKLLLKEKEILEDLENAIDRCDHVAETLTNISVKHG